MPGDIAPLTQAHLDAKSVSWFWFVRILFPLPTGEKRFTDYPNVSTYHLDLGGATDWDATMLFTVGALETSTSGTINDLSDVTFSNVDRQWTTWRKLHGLNDHPIELWLVMFLDVLTGDVMVHTPVKTLKRFDGITEGAHCGAQIRFGLLPGVPAYAILFPKRRIDATLFPWLPEPGMDYQYDNTKFVSEGIPASVYSPPDPGGGGWDPPPDLGGGGRMEVVLPTRGRPGSRVVGPRG